MSVTVPRYQEIAADIAEKLVGGQYAPGDRIHARSTLASAYGVSPETARRALAVLADLGVLEVSGGSGAVILSLDRAVEFLRHFRHSTSVAALKQSLLAGLERQQQDLAALAAQIARLADKAERYKEENPFVPFSIQVPEGSPLSGRTLGEVNFWHHTGATVVAIRSGGDTLLSPGPYAGIPAGATLYYIGPFDCVERVRSFLAPAGKCE